MQASLVNAGVVAHPRTGSPVVGFAAGAGSFKLANLRARPSATIVVRAGVEWVAVEGSAELSGPDDPRSEIDEEEIRALHRAIYSAAAGDHDDWDTFDQVIAGERRAAVLIIPARIYSNPRD